MPPELFFSYDALKSKSIMVRDIYKWLGYSINSSSDLGLYLNSVCSAVALKEKAEEIPETLQVNVLKAMRIMNLILGADPLENSEVLLLWRVAKKSLEHGRSKSSVGLDAAWELDMLAHVRHRGISARIAEPDIKIDINGAEYSIACKRLNTPTGLENLIKDGCEQLFRHGEGIIAINLDIVAEPSTVLEFNCFIDGENYAQTLIDDFLSGQRHSLHRYVEKNEKLDGFLISVSCATRIKESHSDLDLCTASRYLNYPKSANHQSLRRFAAFFGAMRRR
ncbi:hypothetical protein LOY67_13745 [Pseudomonas sp. B21-056]|jgi:hypothetical protein|uniref:hypothetical protein n=1 Tax=Pseudomonas sp. B21-056 TaxID=2895495 RepID=UPI00223012CF|nr:hypothetical protein [Pseudomonas sp. B21-056]UZE21119.1 hypothetical protein LOY67_13745 [Pseudomonas sp. B21-056]